VGGLGEWVARVMGGGRMEHFFFFGLLNGSMSASRRSVGRVVWEKQATERGKIFRRKAKTGLGKMDGRVRRRRMKRLDDASKYI